MPLAVDDGQIVAKALQPIGIFILYSVGSLALSRGRSSHLRKEMAFAAPDEVIDDWLYLGLDPVEVYRRWHVRRRWHHH